MNLERFLNAQKTTYEQALAEIKAGKKTSHWIWWIFPQMKGLGFSYNSNYYGIDDLNEAQDNPKNLFIVEGKVSAEITDYSRVNKSSLYSKGYYDGLTYVYKALKSSKVQTAAKIYKILKREIG